MMIIVDYSIIEGVFIERNLGKLINDSPSFL